MSDDSLVKVENVSKKFCRSLKRSLWYGVQDIGRELLKRDGGDDQLRKNEFWAVNDISFNLKRGECLGLIGANGAGKSTLLKMLNGLIKPDQGRITIRGRVGALIELGAGFNPILTARENVYINGSVLGFSKSEIDKKFDAIVDFAEVEEFIDTPVQNFSSGMKVRLGFAVAAQMEPDVLLIDEVLAVGDVSFRTKCYNAISQLLDNTAIVLVSHNTTHISRTCSRGLVVANGCSVFNGDVPEALIRYGRLLFDGAASSYVRSGNGLVKFSNIDIPKCPSTNELTYEIGSTFKLSAEINSEIDLENIVVDLAFTSISGELVAQCNNYVFPHQIPIRKGQPVRVHLEIPELNLNPGTYKLSIISQSRDMAEVYDWMHLFESIDVKGEPATAAQQFRAKWAYSPLNAIDS